MNEWVVRLACGVAALAILFGVLLAFGVHRNRRAAPKSPSAFPEMPENLREERWTFSHSPHRGAALVHGLFEYNGQREDGYYDPDGNGALDFLRVGERMAIGVRLEPPQRVEPKS